VIVIIAILSAIIFPVFAKVREKARETSCASNLKQLGKILLDRGDASDAAAMLADAVVGNPSRVQNFALLAKAYGLLGKKDLAGAASAQMLKVSAELDQISILQQREKQNLLDLAPHVQLADLYGKTGQQENALNEQRMVDLIRKDPNAAAAELKVLNDRIGSVIDM
jgi:predicted Zn-dependent protease